LFDTRAPPTELGNPTMAVTTVPEGDREQRGGKDGGAEQIVE